MKMVPLFSIGAITFKRLAITAAMVVTAAATDLRPSDHGLDTSPPAPAGFPPQMEKFFGYAPPPPSPAALPWAAAVNDTSWWRSISGAGGGGDRDHVRHVLVAVCSACGALGVLLLAVSVAMCFYRKRKTETAPSCCVGGGVDVRDAGKGKNVNSAAANSKVVPVISEFVLA